jgi:nicotinamidase-related amidase
MKIKSALILIDIQKDYFPGGQMEVPGAPEAGEAARRILDAFRQTDLPVIHVRHVSLRPGATFFLPGTEGVDFHPCVQPLPGEPVVEKYYPNSFRRTELRTILEEQEIGRLVVCGMMSHMCIDATVRAAFDGGFQCIVAHDASAARALSFGGIDVAAPDVHASFMAALGAVYAEIAKSDDIISRFHAPKSI